MDATILFLSLTISTWLNLLGTARGTRTPIHDCPDSSSALYPGVLKLDTCLANATMPPTQNRDTPCHLSQPHYCISFASYSVPSLIKTALMASIFTAAHDRVSVSWPLSCKKRPGANPEPRPEPRKQHKGGAIHTEGKAAV